MGGIQHPNLNNLAKQIWQWCEERGLFIFASYIQSKHNVEADAASRFKSDNTEWELSSIAYSRLISKFGVPEIDLFASRINTKCNKFVSWFNDPDAYAVDAFTLNWESFYFYAFPPFTLILRVLQKIIADKATGIVVVPKWPTQPWYPLFNKLLTTKPIFITPEPNLLLSSDRTPHRLWKQLTLVAGRLSGKLWN